MNEINIKEFLLRYKEREIIWIPNVGNAGDSLIAYGTLQVFDELGLNYIIGKFHTTYSNKLLFYGGGGNLVGLYKDCYRWLQKNQYDNEVRSGNFKKNAANIETLELYNKEILIFMK